MENLKEKLDLAIKLRKKGLSLKKIEEKTGVSFRDLSVLFKYIQGLEDINIKDLEKELQAENSFYKQKVAELKSKIEELKNIIGSIEKEKKDLAINLQTSKYTIKLIKPTILAFLLIIFLAMGVTIGLYFSGSVSSFFSRMAKLDEKEAKLAKKEQNLKLEVTKKIENNYKDIIALSNFLQKNNLLLKFDEAEHKLILKSNKPFKVATPPNIFDFFSIDKVIIKR